MAEQWHQIVAPWLNLDFIFAPSINSLNLIQEGNESVNQLHGI
jgi:hypothetical protein